MLGLIYDRAQATWECREQIREREQEKVLSPDSRAKDPVGRRGERVPGDRLGGSAQRSRPGGGKAQTEHSHPRSLSAVSLSAVSVTHGRQ